VAPKVNDFIMPELGALRDEGCGLKAMAALPGNSSPEQLFAWAALGRAYAGQIVQGSDMRFYLYAPVQEANSQNADQYAIGVAVADSVLGPWKDAHPGGPIVSQSVPEPNHEYWSGKVWRRW